MNEERQLAIALATQKKPEETEVSVVKTAVNTSQQPPLQASVIIRHHQSEYEKRQMTEKLNNKSLNTPSKDGGDSSNNPNVNSQRSPSCSSEVSQKSRAQAIEAPPKETMFAAHPD